MIIRFFAKGLTTDDVAVKLANSLAQLELSERELQVLDQMAPERTRPMPVPNEA